MHNVSKHTDSRIMIVEKVDTKQTQVIPLYESEMLTKGILTAGSNS